jgi:hypothetical protein
MAATAFSFCEKKIKPEARFLFVTYLPQAVFGEQN